MATVPEYRPQAQPGGMPSVRQSPSASPAAFGGGIQSLVQTGRDLQDAGRSIDRIVMENMEEDNRRTARTAFNEAAEKVRALRGEYRNRKGYNAQGVTGEADKAFTQISSELTKTMNQRQKDLFAARWDSLRQSELGTLDMHERDQIIEADDASDKATIAGAQQDAAASYTNPGAVDASMRNIEISARDRGKRNGWDAETTEVYVREEKSKARVAMLSRMLADERPELARGLLEKYGPEMDQEAVARAEKLIKTKEREVAANDYVQQLQALPYEQQLKRIQGIEDKEVRHDVLLEITRQNSIQERIDLEQKVVAYDGLWDRAMDTALGTAQQPLTVPEIRSSDLQPSQKEHLINLVGGNKDAAKLAEKAMEVYAYGLESQIDRGDETVDDQFLMREYVAGRLTKELKTKLIKQWKDQKTMPDIGRAKELLRGEFPKAGEKGTETYTLPDGTEVTTTPEAQYFTALNRWLKDFQDDNRRAPNFEEIMAMGRKLMQPEVEGSWYKLWSDAVDAPYETGRTRRDMQADSISKIEGAPVSWDEEQGVYWWKKGQYVYKQDASGRQFKKKIDQKAGETE